MVKHKRLYLTFFGYTIADWIPCEMCGATASQFHHIHFKSLGGPDTPDNIAAVCISNADKVGCHEKAQSKPEFNAELKRIHKRKYDAWVGSTGN